MFHLQPDKHPETVLLDSTQKSCCTSAARSWRQKMTRHAADDARAFEGEPRKHTVGSALRALDGRVRALERDTRAQASTSASTRKAVDALTHAFDGLAHAFRDAMEELRADHARWEREREDIRAGVEVAVEEVRRVARGAAAREADAERARRDARAVDGRVSEALTYVKDVRNEFLRTEDTVRDALACVKALEERDEARERALAEVQKRAEDGEATLREEIEAVRRVSARAEVAASKAEEVGGLANDMRELARWSKTNAEHQNRRLAHLERDSDSSREERDRALASSVSATAQAMKVQQARLQQIEERGMLRARREAATKADIDVLKKSLGEHHAALLKVCETFDTELELSPSSFPTSSAFVRTTKTLD